MSLGSIELVVFILHVKRKERGLESLPSSLSLSFGSPDVLLEVSVRPLASPSLGSLRTNLDVILLIIPVDVPLLACAKAPGSCEGEAGGPL